MELHLRRNVRAWSLAGAAWLLFQVPLPASAGTAPPLLEFDFTRPAVAAQWRALHDIRRLEAAPDGLRVEIAGGDPYLAGPAADYPEGKPLWAVIELRSEQPGVGQLFYFRDAPSEKNSVRFAVRGGGRWERARLSLPPLGKGTRLRLDPPGRAGNVCVIRSIRFETPKSYPPPRWPRPDPPRPDPALSLAAGPLTLIHGPSRLGDFELRVGGALMARGQTRPLLGYEVNGKPRWVEINPKAEVRAIREGSVAVADRELGGALRIEAAFVDPDGARWQWRERFEPAGNGALACEITISADRDRDVFYLPLFTLFAGAGSFGTNKTQGLFAGLEYLANEPSSSTADLKGPAANRQVPARHKITFPLMAVAAEGRYIGVSWNFERATNVCAVFDSPDRFFGSGGHLMGLLCPGSEGWERDESSLLPRRATRLKAGRKLRLGLLILGGEGDSVAPAIRQYVRLHGLPEFPDPGRSRESYYRLAARGWLESRIREGSLFRHAYWPSFHPGPAADAAWSMLWLADRVGDRALAERLRKASAQAIAKVPPARRNAAQIGHERLPLPALIWGDVPQSVEAARREARALLARFGPDGLVHYRPQPGKPDYAATHWADHANGLTAQVLANLLETALYSGDRQLQTAGLARLADLRRAYRRTVPRGAQTWEIPLHTPDILASAHLVRAFTLGYEISGDRAWLEEARYWAWTGVPFVYLSPPTPGPVGLYNTIAVLGATGWRAPVWIGRPVQWCGLVYAHALYRLARHDAAGPWRQIADGIVVGGIQHTWPETDKDRQGLLPDSFLLPTQTRADPGINPATVFVPALEFFRETPVFDYAVFPRAGSTLFAAGEIERAEETDRGLSFSVRSPWNRPVWLFVNGLDPESAPSAKIVPKPAPGAAHFFPNAGLWTLRFQGRAEVELTLPPTKKPSGSAIR